MSTTHHTPHAFQAPLTSAGVNRPLGELDAAIEQTITTGSGATTTLTAQATAGQANLVVASVAGVTAGDIVYIGRAGETFESGAIDSIAALTITLTANLANTYAVGKPVSKSPVELVDARDGMSSLGARLDVMEPAYNVKVYGALGDGTTDDTAAIAAAIDEATTSGGIVYLPVGTYLISATLEVPSKVVLRGAGMEATVLMPEAAFAGPVLKLMKVAGAATNEFSQAYSQAVEDLTVDDTANRSHACDGILIEECDWGHLRNVRVARLNGYGLKLGVTVREFLFENVRIWRCGNVAGTKPSLHITSAGAGDETNTIHFVNSQVVYPFYVGVEIDGAAGQGSRHIFLDHCQIEGGGGATQATPADYDLVVLKRAKDVIIANCNIGNAAAAKWGVNAAGHAGGNVQYLKISDCYIGDGDGGGVKLDKIDYAAFDGNYFGVNPGGDLDVSATPSQAWLGDSNILTGTISGTTTNVYGPLIGRYPFGIARDASIYRVSADQIRTDEDFIVNNGIRIDRNGLIKFSEIGGFGAGANEGFLYVKDNGAGKTQLVVQFNTGGELVLATQP